MRNKGTLSLRHHREPRLLERDDQFKISIVYNHEFWVYLQKVQQKMEFFLFGLCHIVDQAANDRPHASRGLHSRLVYAPKHTVSQSYITYYHTV